MKEKTNISLVGAGPGDPDLITVKALNRIREADVILYDALVNPQLLKHGHKAEKIFVGKRAGKASKSQEEINNLLILMTKKHKRIVRLKGGDPFIFGRAYEELDYLRKHGYEAEVVPGISSATSLPLLQKVPLTTRGISESFWVLTGTTKDHLLSKDIELAIQSSATIVILMGIKKIKKIAQMLVDNGEMDCPIMIVSNGSTSEESVLISTSTKMLSHTGFNEIPRPGIIVIGEVVKLHPSFIQEKIKQQLWRA